MRKRHSVRSVFLLLSVVILYAWASPLQWVVAAGPNEQEGGMVPVWGPAQASQNNVPNSNGVQTLKTLEERVMSRFNGTDDHGTATPDTHEEFPITSLTPGVKATPNAIGPVYVDLVQRVPVRHAVPLINRGRLASRSGHIFREYYERRRVSVNIAPIIERHAHYQNVDPFLVKAVMFAESHFCNSATSCCGAQGLMQLMPGTGHMMGARDLYDPEQNIAAGTRYLHMLIDRYSGNVRAAVAAYNAGPGNVSKSGAIPNITETRNYVRRVMAAYKQYKHDGR